MNHKQLLNSKREQNSITPPPATTVFKQRNYSALSDQQKQDNLSCLMSKLWITGNQRDSSYESTIIPKDGREDELSEASAQPNLTDYKAALDQHRFKTNQACLSQLKLRKVIERHIEKNGTSEFEKSRLVITDRKSRFTNTVKKPIDKRA